MLTIVAIDWERLQKTAADGVLFSAKPIYALIKTTLT